MLLDDDQDALEIMFQRGNIYQLFEMVLKERFHSYIGN